jgi:DNA-binding transcriptional LysR family regulator
MLIDPRHLEQLAAIIEHGTLQETAKQLGTSQPALSRMISTVEGRIGVQLFERNSRPLVPTEIGRKLSDHGRTIKAARLRASEDIQLGVRGMSGELKIGAPPFLCERLVGETISAFLKDRPNIEVELISGYFPQLERGVFLNQIDVVICPLRLLTQSKSELAVEPLFQDDHVVVGRYDHPLSRLSEITANDLESATWIAHSKHSMLRSDMSAALASYGVTNLSFAFQSESAGAHFEMLRTTDFLTVLPRYAISRADEENGLSVLPVKFSAASMSVGMVTSRNRLDSHLLTAFTTHMRDYVRNDLSERFRIKSAHPSQHPNQRFS